MCDCSIATGKDIPSGLWFFQQLKDRHIYYDIAAASFYLFYHHKSKDDYLDMNKIITNDQKETSYIKVCYCYNCCDHPICNYCFLNCHKSCPSSLKKYELKQGNKYVCACNISLCHIPKRKKTDIKNEGEMKLIQETEESFGLKQGFFSKLNGPINAYETPEDMPEQEIEKLTGLFNYRDFIYYGFYHYYQTEFNYSTTIFVDDKSIEEYFGTINHMELTESNYSKVGEFLFAFFYVKLGELFNQYKCLTVKDFRENKFYKLYFFKKSLYISSLFISFSYIIFI